MTGDIDTIDPVSAVAKLRGDRDRYVAFAFAGSDILLELDRDGVIVFATGALGMLDTTETGLIGIAVSDFVDADDRPYAAQFFSCAEPEGRSQMKLLRLRTEVGDVVPFVASCCRLDDFDGHYFVTLTRAEASIGGELARLSTRDSVTGALTPESFYAVVAEKLRAGREFDNPCRISMIDLDKFERFERRIGAETGIELIRELVGRLRARSVDGASVGMIGPGKFCVIHDSGTVLDAVLKWFDRQARATDPESEGISVRHRSLSLDAGDMIDADALAAVMKLLESFRDNEGVPEIATLVDGQTMLLDDEASRVTAFRSTVLSGSLAVALQPIVDLSDRSLDHYEALARFEAFTDGESPAEHLRFAEEAGLIAEFDYAMACQVIEMLDSYNNPEAMPPVSVNLSARSLLNELFMKSLIAMLDRYPPIVPLLGFEITDSCDLIDLVPVNHALQTLSELGVAVGLDDFGVAGADVDVLRQLDVNFIKIEGTYVDSVSATPRASSFLKAITGLCADLGITSIAKSVESDESAAFLTEHGVEFGQGYLFGEPAFATSILIGHNAEHPKQQPSEDVSQMMAPEEELTSEESESDEEPDLTFDEGFDLEILIEGPETAEET
jgi:EAL domain-containing protein (putative c-di-GMP-specific phosphodiesterase class I)/GGDEF domain-containing protein